MIPTVIRGRAGHNNTKAQRFLEEQDEERSELIRRQTEQTNKIAKDGHVPYKAYPLRQLQQKLQPLSINVEPNKHK